MRRPSWIEAVLSVLVVVLFVLWFQKFAEPQPVGEAVEAKPDKAIIGQPTERLDCVPVVVYRDAVKDKVKLPSAVVGDPNKKVLGAVRVDADIRPHTVTPVIDTKTGEVTTYDTRLALPRFAIDTRGEAGIAYGQRGSERVLRLEARQALADIKAVKIGAVANYDMPIGGGSGSSFIGVGAWYRW